MPVISPMGVKLPDFRVQISKIPDFGVQISKIPVFRGAPSLVFITRFKAGYSCKLNNRVVDHNA